MISYDDPVLQDFFEHGFSSYMAFKQYNMSEILDKIKTSPSPFVLNTSFGENIPRMFMRVLNDNKMIAYLAVIEGKRPFEDEDFYIIDFLAKMLSIVFQLNVKDIPIKDVAIENILMDLIENRFHSIDILENKLHTFDWNSNNSLFILTITYRSDENELKYIDSGKLLPTLKKYLNNLLPSFKSVYYDNKITMLIDLDNTRFISNNIHQTIAQFLDDNNLIGGLSSCFTNILDFNKQSVNLIYLGLRLKSKDCIYNYADLYFFYMLFILEKAHDLRDFCIPQIFDLIKYDKDNNLFIHRNTLRYRLSKISAILNMDIDSGKIIAILYISVNIIKMLDSNKNI